MQSTNSLPPEMTASLLATTHSSPHFLYPLKLAEQCEAGWVRLKVVADNISAMTVPPMLLVTHGEGQSLYYYLRLKRFRFRQTVSILKLSGVIQSLHLVLCSESGEPVVRRVGMKRISKAEAAIWVGLSRFKQIVLHPKRIVSLGFEFYWQYRHHGLSAFRHLLRRAGDQVDVYMSWLHENERVSDEDRKSIERKIATLKHKPLLSVLMPVFNTPENFLVKAIQSVKRQSYSQWELCIADDASTLPHVRKTIEKFANEDSRIRIVWRDQNGHIAAATNSALRIAKGEFVTFLDHDDELAENALYFVAEELNRFPSTDLIYSDEDKIDELGRRSSPHFKPDWNLDLFYSMNIITHLAVYRTSRIHELGGLREGFDGSQDYDLALRVIERIPKHHIRHIPFILYHWRAIPGSVALHPKEKKYPHEAARKAIRDHFVRTGVSAEVTEGFGAYHRVKYLLPSPNPRVSIVICTRDQLRLLKGIVSDVLHKTDYWPIELLIVDNQSQEPKTIQYFRFLVKRFPRCRVLSFDKPFNFSAMNNFAVKRAFGDIIVLLNNDLRVIGKGWLQEMVGYASRREIGAVGAKLLYPNGIVQHGGVILGIGGVAGHAHKEIPRSAEGYMGRALVVQSFSAVTAACLVIRKSVFEEVGGLDEVNLPVAFNDVDFCLRVRERGYRNVWTPYARLFHLESASRGSDDTELTRPRFVSEVNFMKDKWGDWLTKDPAYSPNLTLANEGFGMDRSRAKKPWQSA